MEDDDGWFGQAGLPPDDGSTNLFVALDLVSQAAANAAAARFRLVDAIRREWERTRSGEDDPARMSFRSLRAELATRLLVSERTMETLLGVGRILVEDFPDTLASLERGEVSERHARIIVDTGAGLAAEDRALFEARVLPWAFQLTPALFLVKARTIREQVAAADLEARHREAVKERNVWAEHASDGMATLFVHLPAEEVHAALNRVDMIARTLRGEAGEERTLAQLRADVTRDLLLDLGTVLPPVEGRRR
ncbi:DUF222 domain-containing protein [Naasia aerilata]|uniref:DUF222 domain-containing protein n=1 Tax=Naasia aerilata TaxID=1162966 RepID=A0ABN6XHN3_9MICO|nr:DUF222 domain-containing protein [Naasia aerilata]BDZ44350.1 hypothetical protein GCM10025866_02590 [Naasia aerilata]